MGAVYAAFDTKLERDVALKVLLEEETDGNLALQKKRLLREARLAAKLTHPNIATVYEVDEIDGRLVIVMEMLDGFPLRKILTQRKLDLEEAISIGRDMARALARAHAAGVIHRDIKPENVFITTPSPDSLLAKVLDFGLARQNPEMASPHAHEYTRTNTTSRGDMWGTPGYVSPEQAHGQPVDVRSDIFSFGVVFYEMVANIKPFRGDNALQMMIATTRQEEKPLREIVPALAPEVEDIIRRCLRKNKDERWQNGGELSSALEGFFRGASSSARLGRSGAHNVLSHRLPLASHEDPKGDPNEGSIPTTGGSAAIELLPSRVQDIRAQEQQQRDRMKLVAAIASGIGLAIVVIVIALISASRTRRTAAERLREQQEHPIGATSTASATSAEAPPPPVVPDEPIVAPPPTTVVAPPLPVPTETVAAPPIDTAPVASSQQPTTHAAPTPAGSGAHPHPMRKKPADCAQPFIVDSKGVKIPKLQCL